MKLLRCESFFLLWLAFGLGLIGQMGLISLISPWGWLCDFEFYVFFLCLENIGSLLGVYWELIGS